MNAENDNLAFEWQLVHLGPQVPAFYHRETDPFLNARSQFWKLSLSSKPFDIFRLKRCMIRVISSLSWRSHGSHHRFRYNDAPLQMGPMDFDSSTVVIFAALQPCMDLEAINRGKSMCKNVILVHQDSVVLGNMGQLRGARCVGYGVLRSFRWGSRRKTSLFHCVLCHVPQQSRRACESYFVCNSSW